MTAGPARCAAHPARPAADRCPGCGRPRCAADAIAGDVCTLCAAPPSPVGRRVGDVEAATRAALVALPLALVGAAVVSEYVGSTFFAWAMSFLLGLAVAVAAVAAAGATVAARGRRAVRAVAVLYALVGTGYSYRFVPGGGDPLGPAGTVLPAYAAAVAGAWLGALPRRRVSRRGEAGGRSR